MRSGVAVAVLLSVTPLAGCASAPSTPAQDLAYERWRKCNRFVTVTLERIEPDGTVKASAEVVGEGNRWRACMVEAEHEQMKRLGRAVEGDPYERAQVGHGD